MKTREQILQSLITICRENEIIPESININEDDDMLEYGVIDSMGLIILAFAIEDNFGLSVTQEMLIAELRTPGAIAEYIADSEYATAVAIPA